MDGDFDDDTEVILLTRLILGEAENQSKETKLWTAGTVLNRVKSAAWPNTVHEVILQTGQYDPFKPDDPNFTKIIDPLKDADSDRESAWKDSYDIANGILSGTFQNPTKATRFHGLGVDKEWFLENTYFYWGLN